MQLEIFNQCKAKGGEGGKDPDDRQQSEGGDRTGQGIIGEEVEYHQGREQGAADIESSGEAVPFPVPVPEPGPELQGAKNENAECTGKMGNEPPFFPDFAGFQVAGKIVAYAVHEEPQRYSQYSRPEQDGADLFEQGFIQEQLFVS